MLIQNKIAQTANVIRKFIKQFHHNSLLYGGLQKHFR